MGIWQVRIGSALFDKLMFINDLVRHQLGEPVAVAAIRGVGFHNAIHDEVGRRLFQQRWNQTGKTVVQVELISRKQIQSLPFAKRKTTNAVEFGFEQPMRIREGLSRQRRQHRIQPGRLTPGADFLSLRLRQDAEEIAHASHCSGGCN